MTNVDGPSTVTLSSNLSLSDTRAEDFSIANDSTRVNGVKHVVNASCDVDLTFAPFTQGAKSATLIITYTNGYGTTASMLVQGSGVIPAPLTVTATSSIRIPRCCQTPTSPAL